MVGTCKAKERRERERQKPNVDTRGKAKILNAGELIMICARESNEEVDEKGNPRISVNPSKYLEVSFREGIFADNSVKTRINLKFKKEFTKSFFFTARGIEYCTKFDIIFLQIG